MIDLTRLETLVRNLQSAAYDSGWISGAIEQGRKDLEDAQQNTIRLRRAAKDELMEAIKELHKNSVEHLTLLQRTLLDTGSNYVFWHEVEKYLKQELK